MTIRPTAPALLLLLAIAPAAYAQERPPRPEAVDAFTPSAACSAFLPEDRPVCTERIAEYERTVSRLEARLAAAEPPESCLLHCDLLGENWKLRQDTQRWSSQAVRVMATGGYERRTEALDAREVRRAELLGEREAVAAELADLRRGRVIHLYEHTDTKAIVEHAGDRFEAKPPLRYVGEKRASHSEAGERRIAERQARLAEIDGQIAALRTEAPLEGDPARAADAERMIERMWGDVCTAAEADAWLGACRARCHGAPDDPTIRACQ